MSSFRAKRRKTRILAVQAVYEWSISQSAMSEISPRVLQEHDSSRFDEEFLQQLLLGVGQQVAQLDQLYGVYVKDGVDILAPVDKAILRVLTYEMINCPETPYKVLIAQGIELSQKFGSGDSGGFIHAVLDKLAAKHREHEKKTE